MKKILGRLFALSLVIAATAATPPPSQADPTCSLEDCNELCDSVCAPNGGIPWTCDWAPRQGVCRGICYCF